MTAPAITAQVNAALELPDKISLTTVKRRLRSRQLFGRVAAKKPLLRPAIVIKRLQWATQHRHWTPAEWSRVLWTDESKFELFSNKRRIFVRRAQHEKYEKSCNCKVRWWQRNGLVVSPVIALGT